jgi:hypothetical protein
MNFFQKTKKMIALFSIQLLCSSWTIVLASNPLEISTPPHDTCKKLNKLVAQHMPSSLIQWITRRDDNTILTQKEVLFALERAKEATTYWHNIANQWLNSPNSKRYCPTSTNHHHARQPYYEHPKSIPDNTLDEDNPKASTYHNFFVDVFSILHETNDDNDEMILSHTNKLSMLEDFIENVKSKSSGCC